jgi:uncharacterized repeat protein (TIGR04138 family)
VSQLSFDAAVKKIRLTETRFSLAAYEFVRRSLDHALQRLGRADQKKPAHVRGEELLESFRALALRDFGPMAKTVLNDWGIFTCTEVGEVVFQLVQHGILGKSETDKIDDFQEIYTFREAFESPFLPKAAPTKSQAPFRRSGSAKQSPRRRNRKSGSQTGSSKLSD